jgi:PAS domain S-box-containing protein
MIPITSSGPARILLVDDERAQFSYTQALLEGLSDRYALEWTPVYEAGLNRIMRGGVDAALVDYRLGIRSGLDLAREAIGAQCDVPLVILTGQGDETIDLEAMIIGAADYLDKSELTTELLDRTLRYAMRHQVSLRMLKQREEALRDNVERTVFALDAARIGVWEMDVASGQLTWSEGIERVTGFSPHQLPRERDAFIDLVEPDDRARLVEGLSAAIASRDAVEFQFRIRGPEGSLRWLEGKGKVLGETNASAKMVGVATDITARKQLEEQFLESQKIEAVGRLAGGIAHDFNNLLLAISGYSEIVSDRLGPLHPSAVHVQKIWKAAESAASLTRQLLAFSRRQVLQPQVIDLNAIVERIGSLAERLIGEEIVLETRLTRPLALVSADPGQIEQVVMNLAVNARDAMPGGGRLTIETANVDLDDHFVGQHRGAAVGPHVMLAISDNGVGMDEAVQQRMFEPFFTTKERGKGTGLGLATIYGIVKQSGGSIWVYSELGQGSCFKVYLPVAPSQPEAESVETEAPSASALRGSETILVVEDQAEVRAVTSEMLHAFGYNVLEASCGAEAIAIGRQHAGAIHALLTDVVMPEMSGREVAAWLKADRPELRVVYTSGYTDNAIVHHGVLDSGLAFLQKPFASNALAKKIRDVLDGPDAPGI